MAHNKGFNCRKHNYNKYNNTTCKNFKRVLPSGAIETTKYIKIGKHYGD